MLYAALYGPPKHSIDVTTKIADIHRKLPTDPDLSGPTYIKTHFELTDQHPQLDRTIKAIHIIRNPRDVMLSTIHYQKLASSDTNQVIKKHYAKSFMALHGDPHFAKMGFGTWASNARSWRTTTRFPVLPLRYEELKADPTTQLKGILSFLEISRTDDQIQQAVTASSFDTMRALEIREKNTDKSNDLTKRLFVGSNNATRKGVYFMNKGESNQSLTAIAPGFDAQFNAAFKDELVEFGYES